MIIQLPTAERNPGPYDAQRECRVCGCFLNRSNPHSRCAPCQLAAMPDSEVLAEVLDLRSQDWPDVVA